MKRSLLLVLFLSIAPSVFAQGGTSSFCPTGQNGARISATGSSLLAANGGAGDLVLHASNVPAGTAGAFIMSQAFLQPIPFGQGFLCLSGVIQRLPIVTDATLAIDYTAAPFMGQFAPQSSWNFQFWFRSGTSFDLSDGIEIRFDTQELITNVTTVEQSWFSGHPLAWTGGIELIQDQPTWDAFWTLHTTGQIPPPLAPGIDFTQRSVVAVFLGTVGHGGVIITVRSGGLSVTTLDVRTTVTGPGVFCPVPAVITQPCHIVTVPRVNSMTLGNWVTGAVFTNCP